MHSSLVITRAGLPLGLAAIKFWNRDKFHGANALKRRINPTRVPIEKKESIRWLENLRQSTELLGDPKRCVHIGDRESDIYELFCLAQELSTHFLVRTCVDRLAGEGTTTVVAEMKGSDLRGLHSLQVRNKHGEVSTGVLELRFRRMVVRPPKGKQKHYPELILTAIHATETNIPKDRERIEWKLLTNLPVRSCLDAIEKLEWYAQRWKVETFHKILKSGCRAEEAKLRTAERLVNLIDILTILSWRIFWITMLNRTRHAPRRRRRSRNSTNIFSTNSSRTKAHLLQLPRWATTSSNSLVLEVISPERTTRHQATPSSGEVVATDRYRTGHHDRSSTCG